MGLQDLTSVRYISPFSVNTNYVFDKLKSKHTIYINAEIWVKRTNETRTENNSLYHKNMFKKDKNGKIMKTYHTERTFCNYYYETHIDRPNENSSY